MATLEWTRREAELKTGLQHRLESIHDIDFLEELSSFLGEYADEKIYILTPEELAAVHEGRREAEQGLLLTQDEVQQKIMPWLLKKESKLVPESGGRTQRRLVVLHGAQRFFELQYQIVRSNRSSAEFIAQFPDAGQRTQENDTRMVYVKPLKIFYCVTENGIEVDHLRDARRDDPR